MLTTPTPTTPLRKIIDETLAEALVEVADLLERRIAERLFGLATPPMARRRPESRRMAPETAPPPPRGKEASGGGKKSSRFRGRVKTHRASPEEVKATEKAVLAALERGEEVGVSVLGERAKLDRHRVTRALKVLVEAGKVRQLGDRGRAARYRRA